MNKELMEKIASRKWKEMIGTLSPENEKRLIKANILNYHREAKGLNEGSRRLASKWNIKINADGKDTRIDRTRRMLSQKYYDPIKSKLAQDIYDNVPNSRRMSTGTYKDFHNYIVNSGDWDGDIKKDVGRIMRAKGKRKLIGPDGKFKQQYDSLSSQTIVNKNGSLSAIVNANPDYFDRVRSTPESVRKNSSLKYQNNALTLRHEIDEAITRMKQRKNNNEPAIWSQYETHAAPSVIHKESANVSTLHPAIRQYWIAGNSKKNNPEHRTPADILRSHGVEYGKSGKFNRGAAARNDKEYYAVRRENY
jgi:hypothetical protein